MMLNEDRPPPPPPYLPWLFVFSAWAIQRFSDGETIYSRGDRLSMCYFVHKGVVRLESTDGTVETKVSDSVSFSVIRSVTFWTDS